MRREQWLEKRKDEILLLNYFHVVFTLPHELNTIVLNNKKVMLNCLFAAASKTLLTFGKNQLNGTAFFWPSRLASLVNPIDISLEHVVSAPSGWICRIKKIQTLTCICDAVSIYIERIYAAIELRY